MKCKFFGIIHVQERTHLFALDSNDIAVFIYIQAEAYNMVMIIFKSIHWVSKKNVSWFFLMKKDSKSIQKFTLHKYAYIDLYILLSLCSDFWQGEGPLNPLLE